MTSLSKVIITGMPTPTVRPVVSLLGMRLSIAKVLVPFTVEKEVVFRVTAPAAFTAATVTS